jgi:tetratricopeptide (TPR) repeat protein
LATLHFECALIEAAEGDLHDRKELLLRRTIALASGEDGAGWCHPQRSRILAAAYGELRETASAAASARRARSLCPANTVPVEWEFYLRMGLAQVGLAAEVADDAASRPEFADLGRFLRDWAAYAGGTCPVALSWDDDTPCTVLPMGACARARTGWILRCADDSQLANYAEHLKGRLEAASESPQRPRILEDLADVEWARGEFAAVADAYGQLAEGPASPARRGLWLCRRGDALLRTQRPEEAREAFERASTLWRGLELSVSRLDRLVVDNNVLVLDLVVLGSGAGVVVDPARLEAVSEQLRDLEGETALRPWRLAVENNLLELRTRAEAAQADAGPATAREALERLRDIEADYRRHIQSVDEIGGDGEVPRACSILAFAGDLETNVEDEALGEQE